MLQTIITLLIVAAAVGFAVRGLVRTLKGKGHCSCGCDHCPAGGKTCHCQDRLHLPDIHLDE
ncbi:MAG: FeoB-associated Cys-rich membrane protein [Bacteroidales bacterium]|nr:FeoB-associated Cys-rich membrane protein [Bacteroidales bacterium]